MKLILIIQSILGLLLSFAIFLLSTSMMVKFFKNSSNPYDTYVFYKLLIFAIVFIVLLYSASILIGYTNGKILILREKAIDHLKGKFLFCTVTSYILKILSSGVVVLLFYEVPLYYTVYLVTIACISLILCLDFVVHFKLRKVSKIFWGGIVLSPLIIFSNIYMGYRLYQYGEFIKTI